MTATMTNAEFDSLVAREVDAVNDAVKRIAAHNPDVATIARAALDGDRRFPADVAAGYVRGVDLPADVEPARADVAAALEVLEVLATAPDAATARSLDDDRRLLDALCQEMLTRVGRQAEGEKSPEDPSAPRVWWLGDRGCPPWCVDSDSHQPWDDVDDRVHLGDDRGDVPLLLDGGVSLADLTERHRREVIDGKASLPVPSASVYLHQHHEAREAEVRLWSVGRREMRLSLGEAEAIGHALIDAAAEGRSAP